METRAIRLADDALYVCMYCLCNVCMYDAHLGCIVCMYVCKADASADESWYLVQKVEKSLARLLRSGEGGTDSLIHTYIRTFIHTYIHT